MVNQLTLIITKKFFFYSKFVSVFGTFIDEIRVKIILPQKFFIPLVQGV